LTAEQLTTMRASLGFSPVRQASVRAGDESAIAPALGSREARARRFPPQRLAAMLRGEEGAMRELLAPLLHTHH
ncbi:MAG TPA: hypothetical protein VGG33_19640, partial [Polyangia bacterium]